MDRQRIAPAWHTRSTSRSHPAWRQSGVSATTRPPGRLPPPHTRTCHAGTPSLPFSRVRSPPPPLWPIPCTWLVIAPRARPCVEHSCLNPRCLRLRGRHQRTLKLCRRTIVQCRVQTLFVVDLLQELADGSTSMHQIPI